MRPHPDTASLQEPDGAPPIKPGHSASRRLITLAASIGLLGAVVAAVGAGDVLDLVRRTDVGIALLALALVQAQVAVSAWRWRFTAGRLGLSVPMGRAFLEYALAGLVNMVVPGGVAGDVLRTVRTVRGGAGARAAVRSVLLDRIAGQVAFWLVAGGGLMLWAAGTGSVPGGALAVVAVVPAAGGVAALAVAGLARRGPARVRTALADLGPDVARAYLDGWALPVQAAVSLALAASYVAVFWLAGAAIGAPLPPLAAATLIPLALLAMVVPVSVGGWGLREGAAAVLWPLAGLSAVEGTATAVLYGAIVTVGSLPGLAALRRPDPPPGGPSPRTA